jgi:aryl-alcohol dehydrogenase-like predicted oxidoreductase
MTNDSKTITAAGSGTFALGGDLPVTRLGYGAMRITGKGIWGPPPDPDQAIAVLRRAVELGVDLIDTADSYGPFVSEDLIREALHPYDGVTIATKGGLTRQGPDQWNPVGRPAYLRQCIEMSLRRLDVDTIDLYQLHRIDPDVPAEEQLGVLREAQEAGKIRHIGLSEVGVEEIESARRVVDVVSVQNLFNLTTRDHDDVVDHCTAEGIGFIPWFPLAASELSGEGSVLSDKAAEHGATPSQLALAWLLHRSPVVLPIPGTGSTAHLEENVAAAGIALTDDEVQALTDLVA